MRTVRRWELWQLPRPLQALLLLQAVVAAGLMVGVFAGAGMPQSDAWLLFGLLAMAGYVSERVAFRMGEAWAVSGKGPSGGVGAHTRSVWFFAGVVALPLVLLVALVLFLILTEDLRVRRHRPVDNPYLLHRLIFNLGMTLTAVVAGASMYDIFPPGGPGAVGQEFLAAAAAWGVMYLYTSTMLAVVLMLAKGPPYRLPVGVYRSAASEWTGMAAQGCLLALAWRIDPVLILMGVPPILLLQQALLHNQLRESASRDAKTGLLGATKWRELGEAALVRASTRRSALGVLVVDLDHFKTVNDTHGHLAGDQVLQAVADTMQASVRDSDLVGRFGGEEFVVLLADAGAADAETVAERLRQAIENIEIALSDSAGSLRITASIGLSMYPSDGRDFDELLEQADRALYAAKHGGRNQVMAASAVPPATDVPRPRQELDPASKESATSAGEVSSGSGSPLPVALS